MGRRIGVATERRVLLLMADGLEHTSGAIELALGCTRQAAIGGMTWLTRQQRVRPTGKFSWWTTYKITLGGRERLEELLRPPRATFCQKADRPIIPKIHQQWFDVLQQRSA